MINVRRFFRRSDWVDHLALKQLDHIRPNWELIWDGDYCKPEEDSYAQVFNDLMDELSLLSPPLKYHDNEDRLAEYLKKSLGWNIKKEGRRWAGASYACILEQGGFDDIGQKELALAAVGRIQAAIERGQHHFDDMEVGHQSMLADVIAIILYFRSDD